MIGIVITVVLKFKDKIIFAVWPEGENITPKGFCNVKNAKKHKKVVDKPFKGWYYS